ncbi:hypothetical protein N599_35825 [Saccharopolyspora erythraea D]|nr:hypothetical protein N599_35825 [Saccharopolyspora erythraea D]
MPIFANMTRSGDNESRTMTAHGGTGRILSTVDAGGGEASVVGLDFAVSGQHGPLRPRA